MLRLWYLWPALAAFAVVTPMLIWGYPWGAHDFPFHCYSWLDAAAHFRQGDLFPHWASLANYGYGEPRFVFYPPLSWGLGGTLSVLLPWKLVPGVFLWIGCMGAGCSMYRLTSEWLPSRWALLAGLVYMTNPYELMVVYWRGAAAELLVAALFPLLLLFTLRMAEDGRRAFLPLAVVFAAIWLTNAPGAVISSYSAALVLLIVAIQRRNARPALMGGAALCLGLGLAGFYIVPAFWEQRWVQIQNALVADLLPQNNFVVLHPPRSGRFIATAGVNAALGLALALVAILRRRKMPKVWPVLSVVCGVAAILVFPVSAPVWKHVPELRFVQLPWRWLFVVNTASALLLALTCAIVRRKTKIAVIAFVSVLFCVMLGVARIKHGHPGLMDDYASDVTINGGYWGVPEYIPKEAGRPEEAGQPLFFPSSGAPAVSLPDFPRAERITIQTAFPDAGELRLPLWWYPAWRAEVDGASAPALNRAGQLTIRVSPGAHTIMVRFGWTRDRQLGWTVSLLAVLVSAILFVMFRRFSAASPRPERADVVTCASV